MDEMNTFFDTLKYDISRLISHGKDLLYNLFMFFLVFVIIIFLPILYPIMYTITKFSAKSFEKKKKEAIEKHMDRMFPQKIKSGDFYECGVCGHHGYAYGIAGSEGISVPFCQVCGINGKLKKIPVDACSCKTCKLKNKIDKI